MDLSGLTSMFAPADPAKAAADQLKAAKEEASKANEKVAELEAAARVGQSGTIGSNGVTGGRKRKTRRGGKKKSRRSRNGRKSTRA